MVDLADVADHELREAIKATVVRLRPEWNPLLVRNVLDALAYQVTNADLAVAAVRCAADTSIDTPKAIGWRGRHWRDLSTQPEYIAHKLERCGVCGKPEDRCVTERPGPDDHRFEPTRRVAS